MTTTTVDKLIIVLSTIPLWQWLSFYFNTENGDRIEYFTFKNSYIYKKKTPKPNKWCNISSIYSTFCFEATTMGDIVEEDFCKNYLLLKAEEASCFDCIRVLHSNDLEKRGFFNTRVEGEVIGFRHRWIIFISLVLQKAFLFSKKPMAAVGSTMELCLNYPAFNGGYRRLFFNFLTGLDPLFLPINFLISLISWACLTF